MRLLQRLESQRSAMLVTAYPKTRQRPASQSAVTPQAPGQPLPSQPAATQQAPGQSPTGQPSTRPLAPPSRASEPTMSKPLVGFSDITALHQWQQRHGFISIHGPVMTQLGRLGRATSERLFSLLESSSPAQPLHGTATFVEGTVEGPLLGGNLSVFTRLLGTPFMPNLEGAVLLLEDVGERPYRLDRMWTHLELAGVFSKVSGIALGSFTQCEERGESYTSEDLLCELAVATGLPCVAGFPIGHGDVNEPVPLGVRVRLDGAAGRLTFLESAVSEQ
jgi:muramoyltetrapeptide carboxypeptidase